MARVEASEWGGWESSDINIKHMFGRVTLHFGRFLKLWDEQGRNNELTRRRVEPWYGNNISVIMKQR
jgi:hypothetical protein